MKKIPYGRQNITEEDISEVVRVLKSDYLTQGPEIEEFESIFSKYVGSTYAVAVSNGTAALHLSTLALDVKPGDSIITTPLTFSASANCVRYCGGDVVFTDVDPDTYLIDLKKLRYLLDNSPTGTFSGLIPVDFTGLPNNMEEVKALAEEFNLWIIEDACHAPGGYLIDGRGSKQFCGNGVFSDLAIFSFHPVKHIASGEGGMVTTNNRELYEKLKRLRTHGITKDPDLLRENHGGWYYEMHELGYNYRLTDMQCALGKSQLLRANQGLIKRQKIAKKYDQAFADLGIVRQLRDEKYYNAYHLYVVEVDNREEVYDYLHDKGIMVQVHYIPVHLLPYYQEMGWKKGDMPVAESYYNRCLSLPIFPTLEEEEQDYVIEQIREVLEKFG